MSKIATVKCGVESEGYIRTMDNVRNISNGNGAVIVHDFPSEIRSYLNARKIWKPPHFDTQNCTEIDLKPFNNLEEFIEDFKTTIGLIYDVCKKYNWLYMLAGSTPLAGYAGGHIHFSIPRFKAGQSHHFIFDKLQPFQPFISLLGQNTFWNRHSHFVQVDDCEDTRLAEYGYYSRHLHYNSNAALSPDEELRTLENRFPSSASIFQVLTLATFCKAIIFSDVKVTNLANQDYSLQLITTQVPQSGSTGLIYWKLPKSIEIYKKKRIFVPLSVSQSLKCFLDTPKMKAGLKRSMSELSNHNKRRVIQVFDFVKKGLTFTDYYRKTIGKSSVLKECINLHRIGELEILKDSPIWERVRLNSRKKTLEGDTAKKLRAGKPRNDTSIPILISKDYGMTDEIIKEVLSWRGA